jgi:hypothetical protein
MAWADERTDKGNPSRREETLHLTKFDNCDTDIYFFDSVQI